MKRVLVIEHDEDGPAEGVGERFVERGYELEVFRVMDDRDDPVSTKPFPDPTDYDAIMVTGSPQSVVDPAISSWVHREADMVRTAHEAGVPVLGTCFGGQLLSVALGGEVTRLDEPEFGWVEVESDRPDVVPTGPWFEWHYDRFTVPDGAVEVARNDVSPQVFRIGRSVGTQFHPEITPRLARFWVEGGGCADLEAHDVDPQAMLAETEAQADGNRARADALVDWFLDGDPAEAGAGDGAAAEG